MATDKEVENEHLLQFLYACPVGLIEVAADGVIGMLNPFAMRLMLPIARTTSILNFFEVMEVCAPELRNMADALPAAVGIVCENHRIVVTPGVSQGDEKAQTLSCTMVKLTPARLLVTLLDVSKQVVQEHRLKQAEIWFASLLDDVHDFAVLSLDSDGRIDRVNPSALRQTGFSQSQLLGQTLDVFNAQVRSGGSLSLADQIAEADRDGWQLNEGWQSRFGGERYWCQRLIAVRSETEGQTGWAISGYTVVMREVTQQRFAIDQLTQMLTTDYLTGICNRSRFFEIGERECLRALRYAQPLGLIAMDLDHFKLVNDTYGHAAGDEVLKSFTKACAALLRPSDTFARLGGEEFVVLLPSTTLAGAGELAERLRAAIAAATVLLSGNVLRVTASLGCSELNSEVRNLQALIAAADKALYIAKESGRDHVTLAVPDKAVAEA
jgi:diguanylate cyclase (GGDEF)-like protein/PAS domain S-box-containing protein